MSEYSYLIMEDITSFLHLLEIKFWIDCVRDTLPSLDFFSPSKFNIYAKHTFLNYDLSDENDYILKPVSNHYYCSYKIFRYYNYLRYDIGNKDDLDWELVISKKEYKKNKSYNININKQFLILEIDMALQCRNIELIEYLYHRNKKIFPTEKNFELFSTFFKGNIIRTNSIVFVKKAYKLGIQFTCSCLAIAARNKNLTMLKYLSDKVKDPYNYSDYIKYNTIAELSGSTNPKCYEFLLQNIYPDFEKKTYLITPMSRIDALHESLVNPDIDMFIYLYKKIINLDPMWRGHEYDMILSDRMIRRNLFNIRFKTKYILNINSLFEKLKWVVNNDNQFRLTKNEFTSLDIRQLSSENKKFLSTIKLYD